MFTIYTFEKQYYFCKGCFMAVYLKVGIWCFNMVCNILSGLSRSKSRNQSGFYPVIEITIPISKICVIVYSLSFYFSLLFSKFHILCSEFSLSYYLKHIFSIFPKVLYFFHSSQYACFYQKVWLYIFSFCYETFLSIFYYLILGR